MFTTRLRIKELLRERRWTTKVLAEKTGISESYLTHIKNSTRRWNEDALRKLAEAFELMPTEMLENSIVSSSEPSQVVQIPEPIKDKLAQLNLKLKLIPVVGQIPSQPSPANNLNIQHMTGYVDQFVAVMDLDDDASFCLSIEDNSLAPSFVKGDLLIISPAAWTTSGDIVAVEYGTDVQTKAIVQVNFIDELIVLESINHKKAPIALVRGKDQIRIIGKVIYRYQKTVKLG